MSNEIRNILLLFLKEKVIVASWGMSEIKILTDGLTFSVEAMKYKGTVRISPVGTADCMVSFANKRTFQCRTENLVSALDGVIEKSDDYFEDLIDWFDKQ